MSIMTSWLAQVFRQGWLLCHRIKVGHGFNPNCLNFFPRIPAALKLAQEKKNILDEVPTCLGLKVARCENSYRSREFS